MTDTTATENLRAVADLYLADDAFFAHHREREARRRAALPTFQRIIGEFVAGDTDLGAFRHQIDLALRLPEHDNWGARGFWMMTLNQLDKYGSKAAEAALRAALDGLDGSNVAARIDSFTQFLESEKRNNPGQGSRLAAPGKAPYFISLAADWLNPDDNILVAWPSLRKGLGVLRGVDALPGAATLQWDGPEARIVNSADYRAVQAVIGRIGAATPEIKDVLHWWDERFLGWCSDHRVDINDLFAVTDPPPIGDKIVTQLPTSTFADEPLRAIPAAELKQRIAELRRILLIDPEIIRRVYHALVLGQHVILSGPPGTGKTELAELLPRMLWQTEQAGSVAPSFTTMTGSRMNMVPDTSTAYTVRTVTATDEWSPRQIIGGIAPSTDGAGQVRYAIEYGYLARTIMDNWHLDSGKAAWDELQRREVRHGQDDYRGIWLVIDEFNRAPIDRALGETLTTLGSGRKSLRLPTSDGSRELPLPLDFRIIGTLNTFDRNFLNQISEALKRRFTFIDILPPERSQRVDEQATVLQRVLAHLRPLSAGSISGDGMEWSGLVRVSEGADAPWQREWLGASAASRVFEEGWRLFEVIRLYRQFGTAQAIAWEPEWRHRLSVAFADTLADQLQILYPDELEALLVYLRSASLDTFAGEFNRALGSLRSPKRRVAHLMALHTARGIDGQPALDMKQAGALANDPEQTIEPAILAKLFQADQPRGALPEFAERLERFLFERMI
jgi:MoxR-like ATPase